MSFIHMMHDQNDYCFSKMIIKYKRYCIIQSFGIMRCFNWEWGKLKMGLERLPIVPAWMLQDKNTWSKNLKSHHSVDFLPSSRTRLIQSLHHNTSHYITLHHMHIHIHMHYIWILAGLGYSLLCLQDEVPRIQRIMCRKFFSEITFKAS